MWAGDRPWSHRPQVIRCVPLLASYLMTGPSSLALTRYEDADQQGFARLVNQVHAEFGFSYDPVLDTDLSAPTRHYPHLWVVKDSRRLVGCIALTKIIRGECTIKRMYLSNSVRGQGWGKLLMNTALDQARRSACRTVFIDTSIRQQSAVRLIEQSGFTLIRQLEGSLYYSMDLGAGEPS